MRTTVPVDGQVVSYAQFHLRLVDPDGAVVATANEFGPVNTIAWTGHEGQGVEPGTYTLRVTNNIGPLNYDLEATTLDILADHTPRSEELWTLTYATADGQSHQLDVLVDRGQQVDVGGACGGSGDTGGGSGDPLPCTPGNRPAEAGNDRGKSRACDRPID